MASLDRQSSRLDIGIGIRAVVCQSTFDQAKALNPSDPWLLLGYARYDSKTRESTSSYDAYSQVEARGPGITLDDRKAYVSALSGMARFKYIPGISKTLKELAAMASSARSPTDAWTLGNFADQFAYDGMFDDAILYARQALGVMNDGAARLTLEVSLYGKAAQSIAHEDKSTDANRLMVEARKLGDARSDVLGRLEFHSEEVEALMPVLRKIVK